MAYSWTDQTTIEYYLNQESDLTIGDTETDKISTARAQEFENHAVDEIKSLLDPLYDLPLAGNNTVLDRLAAKLAAAYIGQDRTGTDFGEESIVWTSSFQIDVYNRLAAIVLNHEDLSNTTKKSMPYTKRLMLHQAIRRMIEDVRGTPTNR